MEDNIWTDSDDAPESQGEYSIYMESLADQMHTDLDEIERVILCIEEKLAQPPPEPAAKPDPDEKPEPTPNPVHAQPVLQGIIVRRHVVKNNGRRGWNMIGT